MDHIYVRYYYYTVYTDLMMALIRFTAPQTESFLLLSVGLLMIAGRWVKYEQVGHAAARTGEEIIHLLTAALVTARGILKIGIASKWENAVLIPCCALPLIGTISMYARFSGN